MTFDRPLPTLRILRTVVRTVSGVCLCRLSLRVATAVIATLPLGQTGAATPDFAPLTNLIEKAKTATTLPSGTAIAVVRDGKIVYEGYFGFADIEAKTPVTRDTVFYIASATKPFLALNVLLNESAGKLDTQSSLQQMFPQTRFAEFEASAVTVKDLLLHTSGVDNQPLVWATAYSGNHDAASRAGLVAASYPHAKAKRGTFEYTNVGYNIVSVWLDRQVGKPWQQQLDEGIFAPLQMRHTSASIRAALAAGWTIAKPYSFASAQPRESVYLRKSDSTMHAAGGLVSTAPDLATFLIAELAAAAADEPAAGMAAAMARSQVPQAEFEQRYMDFSRTGYAWGWYSGEYKGRRLLHHFGGFAGFHAHLSFMPQENIGLVVLNNEDFFGAQMTNLIADYVYGTLLEQPDVATAAARRFAELEAKAQAFRASAAQRRAEIDARAWRLSLPRERYAGTYSNTLLGDMTVELVDDRMVIRWGRLAAVATGYEEPDHVRVEFAPNSGEVLAFTAKDGNVDAIAFDRMVFTRTL